MARAAFIGVCLFSLVPAVSIAAPLPAAKVDRHGEPLPSGAVARVGTVRLRGSSACFTPDSKQLATLSDGAVCFWKVRTGKLDRRLAVKEGFHIMAFSPDSRFLVTGGGNTDVLIWAMGK